MEKNSNEIYGLKEIPLPIGISHIVKSQGMSFALPNQKVIEKSLKNIDLVHFYLPFILSRKVLKRVEELNIPHTAAFHMQPENITYTIKLGTNYLANASIYTFYRNVFYNRFKHLNKGCLRCQYRQKNWRKNSMFPPRPYPWC